jgi:hypothetical protein
MPQPVTKLMLFVASPSDVQDERESTGLVVDDVNDEIGRKLSFFIERVMWETHCHPAMGRPQGVINAQIGAYDIFVGIMWKRFGTPTGVAQSGTQEEFNLAYEHWQRDNNFRVLFYFSQANYTPNSPSEMEQAASVLAFKQELATKGLIWEYPDAASFPRVFRKHLIMILFEMFGQRYGLLPNLPLSVENRRPAPPQQATTSLLNSIVETLQTVTWWWR